MTTVPPRTDQITILLVDDEKTVRDVVRRMLDDQDYAITETGNGEEALQLACQWQGPLHLLITDLLLPKISGSDLAHHVLAQHHETKVLFLSGYSEDLIIAREILGPKSAFLQKPFSPQLLVGTVRGLLGLS